MSAAQTKCDASCPCGCISFLRCIEVDGQLKQRISSLSDFKSNLYIVPLQSIGIRSTNSVIFTEIEHNLFKVACKKCQGEFIIEISEQAIVLIPKEWKKEITAPCSFLPLVEKSRSKVPIELVKYISLVKHFSQSPVITQFQVPQLAIVEEGPQRISIEHREIDSNGPEKRAKYLYVSFQSLPKECDPRK